MTNSNKKTVLITGCSSGFGFVTAVHLARAGYDVIATMRNLDKQNPLINELHLHNVDAKIKQLDVTDKTSVQKCIDEIAEERGYIDILINNAGGVMAGSFEDLTDEEIRGQLEVNFFGVQNVTRACIPLMRQRPGTKIINISSVSGFSATPCLGAYSTSKWALEAFSESLRYELKQFDIDVLLVQPGSYITKIFTENARTAQKFKSPDSPYTKTSILLENRINDILKDNKKDISEIPELIEKLIVQKRPKFRNIPDLESKIQYTLRKFFPYSWYEAIVSQVLNLRSLKK